ncbi:MAG: tRNA pseudouridine(38-40) synthase TruA [Microscillaceae bacterium]|nr:tRNA pseudouridine(38-40) synthase TruA [Microscillaceae bacterium]
MRYFLEIQYRGTHYHGWQIQANAHTVQAQIEQALYTLLQLPTPLTASGRTDTGVHALQQFAHFDTNIPLQQFPHRHKLNLLLPRDIWIKNIYEVSPDAHARFDAQWRTYEYRISTHKQPFLPKLCYEYGYPLHLDLLQQASLLLCQYEDFQAFSRVKTDVEHFRCQIKSATWELAPDLLVFRIVANRFLRGMVRAIVGTLLEVGRGRLNLPGFEAVIQSGDRRKAGPAAPPEGLFLTEVQYPYILTPIA